MIKRLTANKIFLWVFALLLTFPMLNIGFRCGYVMFNKNAYESYYGETINEELNNNIQASELETGNYYLMTTDTNTYDFSTNYIYITCNYLYNYSNNTTYTDFTSIQINGTTENYLALYNGSTYVRAWQLNGSTIYKFKFLYNGGTRISNIPYQLQTIEYNKYSYLDNAFDYSVNQFLEDNGNGVIQFTSLFDDMFFATQNDHTANILNYINWYMNYALFLSCSYFVFEILVFFINYARKWLYRFTEDGGK